MTLNQRAALMIRSLMREFRGGLDEHIVMPQGQHPISSKVLLEELKGLTSEKVLEYVDTFAGQENMAEEVRDFVQKAARFIDQRKTTDEWLSDPELAEFAEWALS